MIGTAAPPWTVSDWIGSDPMTLESLRGKVVLVRWFMSTDCPYCTASAPALRQLDTEFRSQGLALVGMYHHKQDDPLDVGKVRGFVNDFGYRFPVAIDRDWRTLRRWWLDSGPRDFTSVTFLIDRQGIIRHIHPGGTLGLGTQDYLAMRTKIEALCGAPP
ncbi:MAG: TlpA disulfide reductase family protein [Myxococcales bacterium]